MKKKLILLLAPLMLLSCGGSKPEPTYTITFNCTDCKAFDESDKEVTSVTVPAVDPAQSLYKEFHFEGNKPFKVPLKSNISIKKTGTDETVEYKYSGGNIFIPVVGNLTVTAAGSTYHKDLETSSWDEIAEISATGRADEFFKVGDTKAVTLKGQSFAHTVRIIDFNHDDLADGSGKAGITFEFVELLTKGDKTGPFPYVWDETNNCDYRQSDINGFLNAEDGIGVFSQLPDDLRKEGIIKPVNKLVGVNEEEIEGRDNFKATSFDGFTYPKLFLLAYDEIHNHSGTYYDYVTPGEAGIYEYYKGHSGDTDEDKTYRIKKIVDGDNGYNYWLRSPYTKNNRYVYRIYETGIMNLDGSTAPHSIAPAFCI
ncbi:MAG: DUF6273 domain-containing protein [Bacilli bacterium]|nr:DUF6273 domain-containing protein [Bacilli bacterium]